LTTCASGATGPGWRLVDALCVAGDQGFQGCKAGVKVRGGFAQGDSHARDGGKGDAGLLGHVPQDFVRLLDLLLVGFDFLSGLAKGLLEITGVAQYLVYNFSCCRHLLPRVKRENIRLLRCRNVPRRVCAHAPAHQVKGDPVSCLAVYRFYGPVA